MYKKYLTIIAILLGLIVSGLSFLFLTDVKKDSFNTDVMMFVDTAGINIVSGTEYKIEEEGIEFITDTVNLIADETPLYVLDQHKIILPKKYAIYTPSSFTDFKRYTLSTLTEIEYSDGAVTLSKGGSTSKESEGLLYDGNNTFVFLETVYLSIDNSNIKLNPLSFVVANSDYELIYYNYGDESPVITGVEDSAYVFNVDSSYRVNVIADLIDYYDAQVFMPTSMDIFSDYFQGDGK